MQSMQATLEPFTMKRVVFFLVMYFFESCQSFPSGLTDECPADCICYSDYLHNQESWKWIESDVLIDKDDPEHERFNPFTEHNEVYENPKLQKRMQRESMLSSVICMIRSNESASLENLFNFIPRQTQVLSLIQAPGSGSVKLNRDLHKKFHSLVGLEIKGYNNKEDVTEISGDCFTDLVSLTYLNLETVHLKQTSVENVLHEGSPRILRINYTFNDIVTNEITSQVLILQPDKDDAEGPDGLLPYSEYKKAQKEKVAPLEPEFRTAFTGLPKLQHLKISGCNLHDISWDMFYKLDNLKYLVLDENDLLFLPDFVFYATSNLSALSLSRNRILNLQTVGLAGLLYLQKLDVSYNNITHLSELSLPPFPHLEVADFRNNPITSIFPNTFEIMNSTKSLYLGSPTTPLDLSPNSFFGLTSLQKLDITNVKIRLLEKSIMKGMPSLKTLKMTGEIPRISYDAFGEVSNLEKLILRNCSLKKISMDAFFGLVSLKELDLSHNSISFLPPGVFEDQVSLREVFLQQNQLTTLPTNLIDHLPVKILRLEGNPWHCSCEMKTWNPQVINRVKRYHIPAPNNTLCQKVYDKGSMCFEKYEPKFEATYSYEKRVSPVCETPMKFIRRSVFQVLRKELKYCSGTSKGTPELLNANNPGQASRNGSASKASYPENFSVDILKALEKQLLAKPVKIKKNRKPVPETPPLSYSYQSSILENENPANEILLNVPTNKLDPIVSSSAVDEFITINAFSNASKPTPAETENTPTTALNTSHPEQENSFMLPTPANTTSASTSTGDKFAWIQSVPSRFKAKNKKKNKPFRNPLPPQGSNQTPAISKKALKLAKAMKRGT